MRTVQERFKSKYVVLPNGCWQWTGARKNAPPREYGSFFSYPKNRAAHRISYELAKGSIPAGMTLDHLCRNTLCVNPDHLEPVTMTENVLRGESFSAVNRRKTHCSQGHPLSGDNLRLERKGRACAMCKSLGHKRRKAAKRLSLLRGGEGR